MSTESTGSEGSGIAQGSTGEAPNAGPDVNDILVDSVGGAALPAGGESGVPGGGEVTTDAAADAPQQQAEALGLQDVLPGVDVSDPNLGAYLTFETSGGDTVISVDADGGGAGAAVPVVTLQNVTNVTLADLLNNNNI